MAQSSKTREFMMDMVIPMIMFFTTIFLVIFVYIPTKSDIDELKKQTQSTMREVKKLKTKYEAVTRKDSKELSEILKKLVEVVPDYINVGALGKFINKVASSYGLTVESLDLSQGQVTFDAKDIQRGETKLNVKIIRGPFKLKGTKKDIFSFLDFLVSGPYATEFDQVKIVSSDPTRFSWRVDFDAVHYYFPPVRNIDPKAPLVVPDWAKVEQVVKYKGRVSANVSPTPMPQVTASPTAGAR